MGWPQNEDGTVDWEFVFTDPETGFIPTIENAKTIAALESCATVVIESLFNREGDEEYRQAYNAALSHIFLSLNGDENMETIRARLVTMLHSIKENRITRVLEYKKSMEQNPEADDRRMSPDEPLAAIDVLVE